MLHSPLDIFAKQTAPVVEEYRRRGILREIDAVGEPSDVFQRLQPQGGVA